MTLIYFVSPLNKFGRDDKKMLAFIKLSIVCLHLTVVGPN